MIGFIRKNKYLLIIVGLFLGVSIAIYSFRTEPLPEDMLWYQRSGEYIYRYFSDWAGILGAIGTFLLALFAFRTMREARRSKLADEIYNWAKRSSALLSQGYDEPLTKTQVIDVIKAKAVKVNGEAVAVMAKAHKLDSKVLDHIKRVKSLCNRCCELEYATVDNEDEVYKKASELNLHIQAFLLIVMEETA